MSQWSVLFLVASMTLTVSAAGRNPEEERKAAATFVADVSDADWDSAIVASLADSPPKLLKGSPRAMGLPKGLPPNSRLSVQLAVVIRADGTQGVYAIVATDSASYAKSVVAFVRRQRYEVPLRNGKPVAIRGNISHEVTTYGVAGR